MNNGKIIELFENSLKETVTKIDDKSKGADQIVKIIETALEKYIIKFPKKKIVNFREIYACEKLEGKVPVPKIVFKTEDFLIEEYLDGGDLDELKLSDSGTKKVYFQLGGFLKEIHKVKTKGFGFIGFDGNGEFKNLRKRAYQGFEENFRYFKEEKLLTLTEIEKAKKYFENNGFYLNSNESVLLHFDYEDWNIRVKNNIIIGILDFGDLSAGPRAYDLARPFISYYGTKKFDYFIRGYGEIDLKEVEFYAAVRLVWMIAHHHYIKNKKDVEKKLKIFRKLIN